MLQAKYLKDATCWIVTSVVIRDQLADIYIGKNNNFSFKKFLF